MTDGNGNVFPGNMFPFPSISREKMRPWKWKRVSGKHVSISINLWLIVKKMIPPNWGGKICPWQADMPVGIKIQIQQRASGSFHRSHRLRASLEETRKCFQGGNGTTAPPFWHDYFQPTRKGGGGLMTPPQIFGPARETLPPTRRKIPKMLQNHKTRQNAAKRCKTPQNAAKHHKMLQNTYHGPWQSNYH